jgi:hypothetical protein
MEFFKDLAPRVRPAMLAIHYFSSRFEIFVCSYEPRKLTGNIFLFGFFLFHLSLILCFIFWAGKTSLMRSTVCWQHAESMTWAISQVVETNGVALAKFPGRGLGLVTDMTSRYQQAPITTLSPCEAVLLFEVCVDSSLTRRRDSGGVPLTVMFTLIPSPHPLSPNS